MTTKTSVYPLPQAFKSIVLDRNGESLTQKKSRAERTEQMSKRKIVVLTGDECRHTYFRKTLSNHKRFTVLATFCEGLEKSLAARTSSNVNASLLEHQHVQARTQAERDFFEEITENYTDYSNPIKIKKGDINSDTVTKKIIDLNPDILVCYGSSLIKSELLDRFEGKFLNVHLGLSPYYRGSGSNVWPLINGEPFMVGATFMHIDAGIDTGKIIHQIRADIFLGDSPHSIGNRLIRKMTKTYADIVSNLDKLTDERQPSSGGKLYKMRDFDANACARLYQNFKMGMIEDYLENQKNLDMPYIVSNQGLRLGLCER